MPFSQKLLVVPAYALALAAGVGFSLTALDVRPARADALLLVDVDSGKVIDEQNSTYPWYPASVTKLMTTYVTFKAVRDHRISLDSVFTVSPTAVAQQPSKMGFKSGTRITVDNALKMLLVHSANDMAVVLAEGVSGSNEKFAEEMNAEAHHLGMTQTNYVNPNGLPADEQITSARDLAILARALILEFPEYDYYWHIATIQLGRRTSGKRYDERRLCERNDSLGQTALADFTRNGASRSRSTSCRRRDNRAKATDGREHGN